MEPLSLTSIAQNAIDLARHAEGITVNDNASEDDILKIEVASTALAALVARLKLGRHLSATQNIG